MHTSVECRNLAKITVGPVHSEPFSELVKQRGATWGKKLREPGEYLTLN
jgi:hypothetical protein